MDREARARFWVVHVRPWVVALVLIAALTLLFFPYDRLLPVSAPAGGRVAAGVSLLGRPLAHMTESEVRSLLGEIYLAYYQNPIDAAADDHGRDPAGVIPPLHGYRLDLEQTVARVMSATAGTAVEPALEVMAARVGLEQFPAHPIYQGNPQKQAVALIINVAWGEEHLPAMLQILEQQKVKAAFFITGRWAEKNPDLVRQISRAGHELANHGYSDAGPASLPPQTLRQEIERTAQLLEQLTGHKVRYYSPHKGEINQTILHTAHALGLQTVLWSRDTIDWQRPAAQTIVERVVPRAQPGDLILMHPTEPTVAALQAIITGLRSRGLAVVSLSQLLQPDPVPQPESVPGAPADQTARPGLRR